MEAELLSHIRIHQGYVWYSCNSMKSTPESVNSESTTPRSANSRSRGLVSQNSVGSSRNAGVGVEATFLFDRVWALIIVLREPGLQPNAHMHIY